MPDNGNDDRNMAFSSSPAGSSAISSPPPVTPPLVAPVVGGKFFNVCFEDSLLAQKGWTRPRWEGTKLIGLYYNEFTDEMEDGKELGPISNRYVDRYIDGIHFPIRSGEKAGFNYFRPKGPFKATMGKPIEPYSASGISTTLYDVYYKSLFWENEFHPTLDPWLKYPPKHPSWVWNPHIEDYVDDAATNPIIDPGTGLEDKRCLQRDASVTTYEEAMFYSGSQYYGRDLHNHAPMSEIQNDIPLTPSRFYKIDPYTQKEDYIDRHGDFHIPKPIMLNPIDPTEINGPYTLGENKLSHDGVLGAENVITYVSRSYEYEPATGAPILANPWIDTEITRSAIVPRRHAKGDISYGNEPVIATYSNAVFVGNSIFGYQENEVLPGPGPDFSYVRLDKAVVFNSDDDSFFVQEIRKKGEDEVFANLMQSTFPWASEFKIKLLDYEHPNNLNTSYNVHWNKGYFSEVASYTTESSHLYPQGHFPGTGKYFGHDGRFDKGYLAGDLIRKYSKDGGAAFVDLRGHLKNEDWQPFPTGAADHTGCYMREDEAAVSSRTDGKGGGFYYLPSNNGGGDAASLNCGFKAAGMGIGKNQSTFPEHPSPLIGGSWQTGPGYAGYMGMDPFPGGLRYYNSKFHPIGSPIYGMSQYNDAGSLSTRHMSGRIIAGTFKINHKNPSTRWWFEQGGQKDLYWASESMAGDVSASLKIFMDECYKRDDLHIITFKKAKNTDKSFKMAYSWFTKDPHKTNPGADGVPAFPGTIDYVDPVTANNTVPYLIPGSITSGNPTGTVISTNPYGNAHPGDDAASYLIFQPYVKPFTTFGSVLFSDYKKVGIKGAHTSDFHNITIYPGGKFDYSSEASEGSALIFASESADGTDWDVDSYGPRPPEIASGSGPVGGFSCGNINAPRFLDGSPYLGFGDGGDRYSASIANPNIPPGQLIDTMSVWTNYWFGFNWTTWITPVTGVTMNYQKKKRWPSMDKWTISQEEKRPNFILTDINKQEHLPNGEGSKGFILIPDNLNPRIKANLDYYLGRAGLVKKEVAPKYKDKTIKKGSYLPSKIKKKIKKRRWWDFGRRRK